MKIVLALLLCCLTAQAQIAVDEFTHITNEQMPVIPVPDHKSHVIALTADETAKALYYADTLAAAKQALEDFNQAVARKYLMTEKQLPSAASVCIGQGCTPPPFPKVTEKKKHYWDWNDTWWQNGFDYDQDYRFIVPKVNDGTFTNNCLCATSSNTYYTCPCGGGGR